MNERSFTKDGEMIEESGTKGERTRLEIMQSAHKLFLSHGRSLDDDLQRRVGIPTSRAGNIYRFDSLEIGRTNSTPTSEVDDAQIRRAVRLARW